LKDFINFLLSIGIKRPLRFSFVEKTGSLINSLTLKENILLDSTCSQKNISPDAYLSNYLKENGNLYLIRLFNKIGLIDLYPDKVSKEIQKITALIKGLLQNADYLFLESPEEYLSIPICELFVRALEFQAQITDRIVIINSPNDELWKPHISQIINQDENCNFHSTESIGPKNKERFVIESIPEEEFPVQKEKIAA
jgi:hypothetical protein